MDSTEWARALAERYAAAWLGDDLDGLLGCHSEAITFHYFGNNSFSGDHVGRDAAIATLLAAGAKAPRKLSPWTKFLRVRTRRHSLSENDSTSMASTTRFEGCCVVGSQMISSQSAGSTNKTKR